MLLHDARIVRSICRGRSVELQGDEQRRVPDDFEKPCPPQLVCDGDRVGRLPLRVEGDDRFEDMGMGGLVEVFGGAPLDAGCDGVARQQHRPDQGFLRLEVVRWDSPAHHLQMTGPRVVEGLDHGPVTFPRLACGSLGDLPWDYS